MTQFNNSDGFTYLFVCLEFSNNIDSSQGAFFTSTQIQNISQKCLQQHFQFQSNYSDNGPDRSHYLDTILSKCRDFPDCKRATKHKSLASQFTISIVIVVVVVVVVVVVIKWQITTSQLISFDSQNVHQQNNNMQQHKVLQVSYKSQVYCPCLSFGLYQYIYIYIYFLCFQFFEIFCKIESKQ